jgi:hypothetical protein
MSKEIWPNFFIVGAARAGTTSLYEYLRRAPGVFLSPVKEPKYFCTEDEFGMSAPAPIRSQTEYLKLFKGVNDETAVGEASPQYLCDPGAPGLIHEAVPEARIIINLRDPVERAFSHYLVHARMGIQPLPAKEALPLEVYLAGGFYAQPVQRYLDLFGSERVKVLIFEEFIRNTRGSVQELLEFLGVDAEPPDSIAEAHNAFARPRGHLLGMIYRNSPLRTVWRSLLPDQFRRSVREKILLKKQPKPSLSEEARKFLEDAYRDDVVKLETLLGRSLPWFHAINPRQS